MPWRQCPKYVITNAESIFFSPILTTAFLNYSVMCSVSLTLEFFRFENLVEELWQLRTYCARLKEHLEQSPNLPDNNIQLCTSVLMPINELITKEIRMLVQQSFIVAKQPNVVLKQHNKFTADIRLLIGDKLGIRFLNIKVGVKLIR